MTTFEDLKRQHQLLLNEIKNRLAELEALHQRCKEWDEDAVYRFWHHSYKVYNLQKLTTDIIVALRSLSTREIDPWFEEIIRRGTNKQWEQAHNDRWLEEAEPIVSAYFHAKYFLDMVCKYGQQLEQAPQLLPSGWAAILELYGLR
jgi:hypothetical protein